MSDFTINSTNENRLEIIRLKDRQGAHRNMIQILNQMKTPENAAETERRIQARKDQIAALQTEIERVRNEMNGHIVNLAEHVRPAPVVDVSSLIHYGEPYDGNTSYFV